MTDMTVALRVLADTTGARTGLKQVAESLREMGVGARVAAVDSAEAALRSATAWAQSGAQVSATATAMGAAMEAGVPDLSAVLEAQSADLVQTALASAEAAAGVAELRAMLHPLAGAAEAARAGLAEVALAEELGALTAQEAAVLTDRLSRALIDVARSADAAGLPLDGLGPAGRAAATGMQQLIEAQTGVSAASPIAELLAQGQALDDLRARFSPVYAEARRLVTEMAQVADAERQGAISATEAALAFDRLETALSGAQAQAAATGVSLEALGLPARGATTDMQRLIEAQTGVTRGAEGSIAAQLRHGQMLDDLRARFNPLFAQTRQYEQELRDIAEAERLSAITADEAAQARARAAAAMGTLSGGIREIGAASGAATAYTANLGYQLNDIAMMMAAGQNPFMLMMQQGPQVTQVFEQMRASGLSIGASLKSALIGMVSPMSLITMAVIGGGAALVQWLTAGAETALTMDEAVEELSGKVNAYAQAAKAAARSTSELRDEFGDGADDARELLREIAAMDGREAARTLARTTRTIDADLGATFRGQAAAQLQVTEGDDWLAGMTDTQKREAIARQELAKAFSDLQAASNMQDADARLAAILDAAERIKESFEAGADAAGGMTEADEKRLDPINRLVLAAQRLKEIRDAEIRAERDRLREMQQGEDRATRATRPDAAPAITGEATKASWDARADLDRQAAMAALIAEHGRDSLEVARAQVEEERRLYEVQLQKEAISEPERQRRLEAWDLAKGMPALESQRRAEAERLLATLQQEEVLQRAIATYGEDSAEVARLRADQERAAFEATLATLGVSDELRGKLMEAWENARGLGATDMAGGIASAREEARAMADEIMRALGAAQALSAQGVSGLRESELRVKYAKDPVRLAGELARNRMITAQGVRREGAEGLELASLDAEVEAYARNMMQIERNNIAQRAAIGKGAKGGGAGGRDLAGLSKEAMEILSGLDVAAAPIGEKVKVGLISVADGENQMAQAKGRAASQLADLIARLDRLGPAGKAAADAARVALADLAAEAGKADQSIRDGMIKSFEDSFVRSLATGKNAMSAFADHVKMELARAFTQKFVTPMISPLINSLMGMFTGIFSAKGNVIAAGRVVPFASGGVPDLPSLKSHSNTVVDRPTAFAMKGGQVGIMGEAGAEAILPLLTGARGPGVRATGPDGTQAVLPLQRAADGALGVGVPDVGGILRRPTFFAKGGVIGRLSAAPRVGEPVTDEAGTAGLRPRMNVVINNNHPTAQVTAEQRPGADGMSMDIVIEQIDAGLADRWRRGIGPLSGLLGGTFGLTRQGR